MEDSQVGVVKRTVHVHDGDDLSVENTDHGGKDKHQSTVVCLNRENGRKEQGILEDFDSKIPSWREQISMRGIFVSFVIGTIFSIIVMNLNLTTGLAPTMNVSAGLLGFVFIKSWSKFLARFGLLKVPFTRQENTIIQTCIVACYSLAYGGGFGSYLVSMNRKTYERAGVNTPGNNPDTVKEPHIGWMIGYLLLVTFVGILALVPLRKVLIIDYRLTYPSGTATAVLINGFHTPHTDKLARKQVRSFGKYFTFSFLWGLFQWFFAAGDDCGFVKFPFFGLKALEHRFYFDFNMIYVGAGMICPRLVTVSMLIGGIISWGIMWPLISNREGDWYPHGIPESSIKGINGYKVFVCVSLILGDGLYNFLKVLYISLSSIYKDAMKRMTIPLKINRIDVVAEVGAIEKRRDEVFMKDTIPVWIAASGYVGLAAISTLVIPQVFPHMKWYYVFICYVFAPVMAFCNAYGAGLTDQNLSYNYGKVALFAFAAWAGEAHGGVIVGLVTCGVMKSFVATSADLMQDFKTGHLTLSSPRSMFVSQLIGNFMGCIIAPLTFWLFYEAFDVGNPDGEYKAPFALIYRNMAILGVEGFSALPNHCLQICCGAFIFAVVVNVIREKLPDRISAYIPLPMAMAIPFYVGSYFAIDMCVGSAILFIWHKIDYKKAETYGPTMASGLICGEGLWTVPEAILSLTKVKPPICMKFLSNHMNQKVDKFLHP